MATMKMQRMRISWKFLYPYLFLGVLLGCIFAALLFHGLDFEPVGDNLQRLYLYETLGIRNANIFMIVYGHGHPLANLITSIIYILFSSKTSSWLITSLLFHFVNGLLCFAFLDFLFLYRWRWVSFSASVIFIFNIRQFQSIFDVPIGSFLYLSLGLALLSVWFYVLYVRRNRQNIWWRDFSILFFVFAFLIYETAFTFFLVYPVLAYFEDRRNENRRGWLALVGQYIRDLFWYPVAFGIYMIILFLVLPPGSRVGIDNTVGGFIRMLSFELSFSAPREQLVLLAQSGWPLAALALGAVLFSLLFAWAWSPHPDKVVTEQKNNRSFAIITISGTVLILGNLALVAPTGWSISQHARLGYPLAMGLGLFMAGGMAWLLSHISAVVIRRIVYAGLVTILGVTGFTALLQTYEAHYQENLSRVAVINAVRTAIPRWVNGAKPYILLYSDAHPSEDLGLNAQDVNFPLTFALLYEMDWVHADAIYFDVPDEAKPEAGTSADRYSGPYILVEDGKIYSPLRPIIPRIYQPGDANQVVILYYDGQSGKAQMVDELPADVLQKGNIVVRGDSKLRTNYDLIVQNSQSGEKND